MRLLTQEDICEVSGGNQVVFVAADVIDGSITPSIANLVSQLMNGQMDPSSFMQSLANSGAQLTQYMYVSMGPGMMPPPPCGPMPPPPCPPFC